MPRFVAAERELARLMLSGGPKIGNIQTGIVRKVNKNKAVIIIYTCLDLVMGISSINIHMYRYFCISKV